MASQTAIVAPQMTAYQSGSWIVMSITTALVPAASDRDHIYGGVLSQMSEQRDQYAARRDEDCPENDARYGLLDNHCPAEEQMTNGVCRRGAADGDHGRYPEPLHERAHPEAAVQQLLGDCRH